MSNFTRARLRLAALLSVLLIGSGACSLRSMAVNAIVPTLADPTVYLSEEDPELVREALPFLFKTLESILTSSPEQKEALLSACQVATLYANAFSRDRRRFCGVGRLRGGRSTDGSRP